MAIVNLGHECDDACVMCTYKLPEAGFQLSIYKIREMIDNLKLTPGEKVVITGGEPTIRDDIFEIILYSQMRHPNNEVYLATNGQRFQNEEFCKRMARVNPYVITEIHGSNPELHDAITQHPGSFQKVCEGIQNMINFGVRFQIRLVAHKLNYQDLPNIARLIVTDFPDMRKTVIFPIDYIGNAKRNKEQVHISLTELIPYVMKATDIFAECMVEVNYFQIPICMLPPEHQIKVVPNNVKQQRVIFDEKCNSCLKKNDCSGIWKTYAEIEGTDELKPILSSQTQLI